MAAAEGASASDTTSLVLRSGGRSLHRAAVFLGLVSDEPQDDGGIKTIKDCSYCPELIHVGAGTAQIGADDNDPQATSAERPRHVVRVWPGFAIATTAATSASYGVFLNESGRTESICAQRLAANDASATPLYAGPPSIYASCVSATDADAYVTWLTMRTGRPYRLPTAVEWEFAMRTIASPELKSGDVGEIVADCWKDSMPDPGLAILASQSGAYDCPARMLKGGSASEDPAWHRPSARRMLPHGATLTGVGFRVMRDE